MSTLATTKGEEETPTADKEGERTGSLKPSKISLVPPPTRVREGKHESLERRIQRQAIRHTLRKTPPLQSVYVRWKEQAVPSAFSNAENMKAFFASHGPVERIVYYSRTSAIVVFKLIRSACTAAVNTEWKCRQHELRIVWLPECLQIPVQRKICLQ